MRAQYLVIAKAPVPGRVKTRLCPPCTPDEAAAIAAAALADTIETVSATPGHRRVLVLDGRYEVPTGWHLVSQRGSGLAERLCHAFLDTARAGVASVLVGMDTPQVSVALLTAPVEALRYNDAVLGLAADGGWWTLALRDPRHAEVLRDIPMSTPDTGALTLAALCRAGLTVGRAPILRDVDTVADATAVAALNPDGRFAQAVRRFVASAVPR